MITEIKGLPENVAAFKAEGKVTADDYNKVTLPVLERISAKSERINFLLFLDTDVSNFEMGAWAKDVLMGIKYAAKWHKMAIISDEAAVRNISELVSPIIPGTIRTFKSDELDAAKAWISEA